MNTTTLTPDVAEVEAAHLLIQMRELRERATLSRDNLLVAVAECRKDLAELCAVAEPDQATIAQVMRECDGYAHEASAWQRTIDLLS